MSGSRKGWDLAQIRTSFLADPEFQRLRRENRTDEKFLAAVGLWAIAVAQAWREDNGDVGDVLDTYPSQASRLASAGLVADGTLRGFEAWIERMRARREADADRKRTPKESSGVQRSPKESSGVLREERRGEVEERKELTPFAPSARDGLPNITPEVAAAWETATGRSLLASGEFACRMLDELCERQGVADVLAAIPTSRASFPKIPSPTQLAADLRNRLEPLRKGTLEEAPAFQPAPKRPAPPPVDAAERERILRGLTGKGTA